MKRIYIASLLACVAPMSAAGPIGSFPACNSSALGALEVATDAIDAYDCTGGGGSAVAVCVCTHDEEWVALVRQVELSRYPESVLVGPTGVDGDLSVSGKISSENDSGVSLEANSGSAARLKVGRDFVEIRSGLSIVRFMDSLNGIWAQNVTCIWVGGARYCQPSSAHPYECRVGEPGIYFDLEDADFCRCARPVNGTAWRWMQITSRFPSATRCRDDANGQL